MGFVKNMDLGYNQEQAMIIPIDNNDIYNNLNVFKQELQNDSRVAGVSMMSGEPGGYF